MVQRKYEGQSNSSVSYSKTVLEDKKLCKISITRLTLNR